MPELLPDKMNTEAIFFALLRSGLWGTPADTSVFTGDKVDWKAILQLAKEQAVLAVTFDGMETLPSDLQPPKAVVVNWFTAVVRIEQSHELLNRELANLVRLYRNKGIFSLLLKGQGVANLYVCPKHRQCGDIDLYLDKDYEKAKQFVKTLDVTFEPESDKHLGFQWNGVEVENHRKIARFYSPSNDKKLKKFLAGWLCEPQSSYLLGDVEITVPAPGFNAVYLLIHASGHLMQEGIGLRQVCDWARLFAVHSKDIDRERFVREIRFLDMEAVASAFGYVLVNYLGLPPEDFPLPVDGERTIKDGQFLINDILMGGNFGVHHDDVKNKPKQQNWKRKTYTYTKILSRCRELKRFSPAEARWYPVWRFGHLINKMVHGRLWQ